MTRWFLALLLVAAALYALVDLPAPGTAGEVCHLPDAADCDSHTGGELEP